VKNWDDYFFDICEVVGSKSKDLSTHVGCVIVGPAHEIRSTGFNGFPSGVEDDLDNFPERYKRPEKYVWTEHSERNAIYLAARHGVSLVDCTIYLTWMPCAECARAIIQSGIQRVKVLAYDPQDAITYPMFRFDVTLMMFEEAGISVQVKQKLKKGDTHDKNVSVDQTDELR